MAELLTMLTLSIIPKNMDRMIAPNLNNTEFRCHCHRDICHYTLISTRLIYAWGKMREAVNKKLKVNSGYRCQNHNRSKEVGGTSKSSHTTGNAVDISFKNFTYDERAKLIDEARKHFDYVKLYIDKEFIHCQING